MLRIALLYAVILHQNAVQAAYLYVGNEFLYLGDLLIVIDWGFQYIVVCVAYRELYDIFLAQICCRKRHPWRLKLLKM